MTEGEAAAASGRSRWRIPLACAAPALVLLAAILPFLRYHEYALLLPESLILIAGAAALGAALGAMSLLRPATLGPAVMALALCAFAVLRPEMLKSLEPAAAWLGLMTGSMEIGLGVAMAAIVLAAWGICHLLRRHLPAIAAATFGTIVLSTLALPVSQGGAPIETGALPSRLADLPPVIHIILDEHIGLAGLPADNGQSAAAETLIRKTYKDFALYPRAYSRFSETQYSLSALMNGRPGAENADLLTQRSVGYTLENNRWFDLLESQGYAVRVYQSDWLDMCSQSQAVDSCYTYPLYSMNAIQRTLLPTRERLTIMLSKLGLAGPVPMLSALASRETETRFLSDLAEAPRGVAYIVHLLTPHYGYLYRQDCSLDDPDEWAETGHLGAISAEERAEAYREYLPQLICAQRWVGEMLEAVRKLGVYDDATIVVHGDHGSRLGEQPYFVTGSTPSGRDLLDHFSTFLAVKAPSQSPGVDERPTEIQAAFARRFLGREKPAEAQGPVFMHDRDDDTFARFVLSWPGQTNRPDGKTVAAAVRQQAASISGIGLRGAFSPATP